MRPIPAAGGDDALTGGEDRLDDQALHRSAVFGVERGTDQHGDVERPFDPSSRLHELPTLIADHRFVRQAGQRQQTVEQRIEHARRRVLAVAGPRRRVPAARVPAAATRRRARCRSTTGRGRRRSRRTCGGSRGRRFPGAGHRPRVTTARRSGRRGAPARRRRRSRGRCR